MRFIVVSVLVGLSFCVSSSVVRGQQFAPINFEQSSCSALDNCSCSGCQSNNLRFLCEPSGCGSRNWVDIDFLLLHSNGYAVPELIAGSPAGTPRSLVGLLDNPATTNLLGNERLGDGLRPGLQISFGHWLDDCGDKAITGSIFSLDNGEDIQTYPSDPSHIISRPFFNTDPSVNGWDSELVNMPGIVDGTITVASDSNIFSGTIGLQKKLCCSGDSCSGCGERTDFYIGYRMFGADESLTITELLNPVGGLIPAGTRFDVLDQFATENRFHGVELGLTRTWQKQRWTFGATGKVALGNVSQKVSIDGSTAIAVPTIAPIVQPYGILASTSNIGVYKRDRFGVLGQAQLEIGYQINRRTTLKVGYNAIYLNDVTRPGDHIDLHVNATQIDPNVPVSGPVTPTFDWKSDALYLHGLSAGLELTF